MTTKIEEIIDTSLALAHLDLDVPTIRMVRKDLLKRLDAAGLKVLPKEATEKELTHAHAKGVRSCGLWQDIDYQMAVRLKTEYLPVAVNESRAAFDPNTWKPAE